MGSTLITLFFIKINAGQGFGPNISLILNQKPPSSGAVPQPGSGALGLAARLEGAPPEGGKRGGKTRVFASRIVAPRGFRRLRRIFVDVYSPSLRFAVF